LRQAIPGSITAIIMFSQVLINLSFIGHLNNPILQAGVGMGNSIQNIFGMSIVVGFNGAFATLAS